MLSLFNFKFDYLTAPEDSGTLQIRSVQIYFCGCKNAELTQEPCSELNGKNSVRKDAVLNYPSF